MASIQKHHRSKYYYCAFTDSDGERTSRSTRQTDRKKAMQICVAYEEFADKARAKQLSQRQVRKVMSATIEKAGGEPPVTYTTREWFTSWKADVKSSKAPGTSERYGPLVDEFLDHLGPKADLDLSYLTQVEVQKFRDKRVAEGISNNSADLLLKTLRICLNLAVEQKHIDANPADAISLLEKEESIKECFTRDQVRLLLKHSPDDEWKGLIKAGYYTGGRIGDCARYCFEQLDLKKRILKQTPKKRKRSKNPKTFDVPLHDEFFNYIQALGRTSGPIFPMLSKKRVGGKTGLSLSFRAIIDRAGIPCHTKVPRGKRGRKVYSLGYHSLRHSFNSDMANSNVSVEIRQKLIGHASARVNAGYTHLELETLREAIATLPPLEGIDAQPKP
jgi:site-specific recombinase XerD